MNHVKRRGFALLLDGELSFRFYAFYEENEEAGLFLEMSTASDFRGATSIRMKYGVGDSGKVPIGEEGRTYYLRLRTDAYGRRRYSETLTYSVESYIANTTSTTDNQSLIALNQALQQRACLRLRARIGRPAAITSNKAAAANRGGIPLPPAAW